MRRSRAAAVLVTLLIAGPAGGAAEAQSSAGTDAWNAGLEAYRGGRFEEAAGRFRQVTESNPDYAPAHTMLGQCLLQLGEPARARSLFEEALRLDPGDGAAKVGLARAMLESGKRGESLPRALAIDPAGLTPKQPIALDLLLTRAAVHVGRCADALPRVAGDARKQPDSYRLQIAAARLADGAGARAQAAEFYLRAFRLHPEDEQLGRVAVGRALAAAAEGGDERQRWLDAALDAARTLAAMDHPAPETLAVAGRAALEAGHGPEAVTWLGTALAARSGDARLAYRYAKALVLAHREDEAAGVLERALVAGSDPELARSLHALAGKLAAHHLDIDGAVGHFEAAGWRDTARQLRETAAGLEKARAEKRELLARIRELEHSRDELRELGQNAPAEAVEREIGAQRERLERVEASIAAARHALTTL